MTILVTGGAGYIGSHTVRHAARAGPRRRRARLDGVRPPRRRCSAPSSSSATSATRDLGHRAVPQPRRHAGRPLRRVQERRRVDGAARASTGCNNVAGTVDLVEAMLAAGVARHRVLVELLGERHTRRSCPVAEDAPIAPESVYAETQGDGRADPRLVRRDARPARRQPALLQRRRRERRRRDRRGLDPVAQPRPARDEGARSASAPPVQVFGNDYPTPDGTCIRDYIHVDDLADAHIRALDLPRRAAGRPIALNVGTGVGSSVMDVIHATERISGRAVPYEIAPRRAGDPVATYADPTRIRATLGWQHDARPRRDHRVRLALAQHAPRRLRRLSVHASSYRKMEHFVDAYLAPAASTSRCTILDFGSQQVNPVEPHVPDAARPRAVDVPRPRHRGRPQRRRSGRRRVRLAGDRAATRSTSSCRARRSSTSSSSGHRRSRSGACSSRVG